MTVNTKLLRIGSEKYVYNKNCNILGSEEIKKVNFEKIFFFQIGKKQGRRIRKPKDQRTLA